MGVKGEKGFGRLEHGLSVFDDDLETVEKLIGFVIANHMTQNLGFTVKPILIYKKQQEIQLGVEGAS